MNNAENGNIYKEKSISKLLDWLKNCNFDLVQGHMVHTDSRMGGYYDGGVGGLWF